MGKHQIYQTKMISNNKKDNMILNDYELKVSIHNHDDYKMEDKSFINFV